MQFILKRVHCYVYLYIVIKAATMTSKIGDYFIPSNAVNNITNEDYQKVDLLVNAAKAFARSTHQCVYIIDYFKKEFLYEIGRASCRQRV